MDTILTLLIGLISGFVGWLASEFLAKPFRRGIDLVAEVATSLIMNGNVQARARQRGTQGDEVVSLGLHEECQKRLAVAEGDFRKLHHRCLRKHLL
jgi:hypothetical protein